MAQPKLSLNTAVTPPLKEKKEKDNPHVLQMGFLNENRGNVITVFLMSGIRVIGKLRSFDVYTLLIEDSSGGRSLVFKHAVSTIREGVIQPRVAAKPETPL